MSGVVRAHPRVGGEHGAVQSDEEARQGSSPRRRGAPETWHHPADRPGLIPA